jgi:hypothetical protein
MRLILLSPLGERLGEGVTHMTSPSPNLSPEDGGEEDDSG